MHFLRRNVASYLEPAGLPLARSRCLIRLEVIHIQPRGHFLDDSVRSSLPRFYLKASDEFAPNDLAAFVKLSSNPSREFRTELTPSGKNLNT